MDPELKKKLTDSSAWIRFIYTVFFLIILYLTWWLALIGAAVQFLFLLFKGHSHPDLAKFLKSLSGYIGDVAAFVTYSEEERPFPFRSWKDETKPGSK